MLFHSCLNMCVVIPPTIDYNDPMSIMEGRTPITDMSIWDAEKYFPVTDLYAILERDALVWAIIILLVTFISMLFVNNSEKLAEKKKDILHKLFIVFLIASLVSILNILLMFLDNIFH